MADALAGRVAVITGAGGGLGREYARLFAAEGALLVLADRPVPAAADGSADPLSQLIDELTAGGAQVVAHRGDIGADQAGTELVSLAATTYGTLDVLVNNAGNWVDGPFEESALEAWDSIMHVHLRGHFLALRAAAHYWVGQRRSGVHVDASVINTTSRSALNMLEGHSVYAAAKSGIVGLTHVAAKELAQYGVRVNCVAPAARTAMTLGLAALADKVQKPTGLDAFDEWDPANVAPLVAYLATRNCAVTGEILFARGGTVQRYVPWQPGASIQKDGRWTIEQLAERVPALGTPTPRGHEQ